MRGIERVEGEKGQAEEDLRQRGGRITPQVAEEDRDRLRSAGPDQEARDYRQELRCGHPHHRHRPEPAAAGQHRPPGNEQHEQRW
jgi:hypothetical protein